MFAHPGLRDSHRLSSGAADGQLSSYHASVVAIGGGIMGCSTLYHLAKMAVTDAVLVDRNMGPESARIAAELDAENMLELGTTVIEGPVFDPDGSRMKG